MLNLSRLVASNQNLTGISGLSSRAVSKVRREGWREIDGCPGRRLNQLDVLAVATADELLNRKLNMCGVDDAAKLLSVSNAVPRRNVWLPYPLIN